MLQGIMENIMEITVKVRSVYGVDTIYPVCEKAKLFASMCNTRTLTQSAINHIKSLGYTIKVEQTELPPVLRATIGQAEKV
jgi:hypothetical protein